jgi:hypothetical protein
MVSAIVGVETRVDRMWSEQMDSGRSGFEKRCERRSKALTSMHQRGVIISPCVDNIRVVI